MKATLDFLHNVQLEFEVATTQDLFKQLGPLQELSNVVQTAPNPRLVRLLHRVASKNGKNYDYYELQSIYKGWTYTFDLGQKQDDAKTLFPKTKDDEGNRLGNHGWSYWNGTERVYARHDVKE